METNHSFIIRATNRLAIYMIGLLFYWVVIFLTITVFDLKVFREQMTGMFFLSLVGIFAILGGIVILNIMSNLSKISASIVPVGGKAEVGHKPGRVKIAVFLLTFPVMIACLFAGNEYSAQRKKALLISSAESFVSENQAVLAALAQYKFSADYVKNAEKTLGVLNKIDKNFPEVMIIFPDAIEGKNLFLGFRGQRYSREDKEPIDKARYVYSTTQDERDYLNKVYSTEEMSHRFSANKGNYQLYFPTTVGGKKIVMYFSDYQRYGKFGS